MSKYATMTQVPSEKSRMEIEKTLARYGATSFCYASEPNHAVVGFRANDRYVKMILPLPDIKSFERKGNARVALRSEQAKEKAHEQAVRTRWRCLALAIKAKLEIVENGISSFENEFLANVLMADGRTVGAAIAPMIAENYSSGKPVTLMLAGK